MWICQIVFQIKDDKIAGIHPEGGRFIAVRIDVAITSRAVWHSVVVNGEINLQNAIVTPQVFRFIYDAAFRGPRALVRRNLLGAKTRVPGSEIKAQECEQRQLFEAQDQSSAGLMRVANMRSARANGS